MVRTNGRRLEESEMKKKEAWGEERGGGDCLYSNLTRCHFFFYLCTGLSIPRGEEETHTVPHPACHRARDGPGQCQVFYRRFRPT